MTKKFHYFKKKVVKHLFEDFTVAFYIQEIVAVCIFILGLFIFVSSVMPPPATAIRLFPSQNYLSSSFSMSVFPLTPQDRHFSNLGSASISAEFVHETEHVSPEVASSHTGYCVEVPILLYHHIQPVSEAKELGQELLTVDPIFFEQHLAYLQANGYTTITIEQLGHALRTKTALPEKSIAITIDDGYEDNYVYAYQLLQKYGLKGNFMIPTGLVEKAGYMNWFQVKEIASTHGVYNHTTTHAPLGYIPKEKIVEEVTTADKKLTEMLGKKTTIITYPYGSYNELAIQTLKELGFSLALTTVHGRTQCDTTILKLYREHVGNASLEFYGL